MIKTVIFDVDGTLVDTLDMHAETWQRTLQEYGKEFEFSAVRAQIGQGDDQLMPVFLSKKKYQFGEQIDERVRDSLFGIDSFTGGEVFLRNTLLREIDATEGQGPLNERKTFAELCDYFEKHYVKVAEYVDGRKVAGVRSLGTAKGQLNVLCDYFGSCRLRFDYSR